MKKVLLVAGHTDMENNSVANKTIVEEFHRLMPDAELDILSELYPDFKINVEAEQQKLVAADVIVLQFPVFWYSQPSLLHKWMEDTFCHGFSHGSTGKALVGKKLIASFTTGAPAEAYAVDGPMGHTVDEMVMSAIDGVARLTGMQLMEYVYTPGVSYALRNDSEALAQMVAKAKAHAQRLADEIKNI
jgi:glutathione-regulated potassium-efflux system ancillary protein KefF